MIRIEPSDQTNKPSPTPPLAAATPSGKDVLVENVRGDLRENYEFSLFSILPGLTADLPSLLKSAKKLGIDEPTAVEYADRLVQAGFWALEGQKVKSNFELLELGDITVKDYLSMTVSIISQLSDDKSYAYDYLSIVTNRALIRTFAQKVNQALKELHQQSQVTEAEKDCVFSWTHTGVVAFEKKKIVSASEEKES